MVWRRLRVPGVTSLATLHEAIQIINNWGNVHLHRFHIYAVDYGINYIGGTCYRDNAYKIKLDDFEFSEGDKFYYEYNFFKNHIVDIRIECIDDDPTSQSDLFCVSGNGVVGKTKHHEIKGRYKFLKALAKATDKTTVGEILPYVKTLRAGFVA
jgi:hypothetical protein